MFRHPPRVKILLAIFTLVLLILPAEGGPMARPELTVAFSQDPVTMDPRFMFNIPGWSVLEHVYERLVGFDSRGQLVGVLATSWKQVSPTVLEFKLRQGIKFHDGELFDAAAVKFNIENIIAPESKAPNKDSLAEINRVETPDPYTVRVITKFPSRPLLNTFAFIPMIMAPGMTAQRGSGMSTAEAGTGPYKLVEYIPGQRVVLEANDDYRGGRPNYGRITFRVVPETGTRVAALRSGEVMMINNVPPDQINSIIGDGKLTVVRSDTSRVMFVALRFQKPTIRDRRIREAINLAIDRKALAVGMLQGTATVADSPIAPPIFGRISVGAPPYDPARAKVLMKDANYAGEALEFYVPNGRYLMDKQIGEAIAGYLREAGFNVNLHVVEWGAFAAEVFGPGKTWDMALYGWSLPNYDPDYLFDRLFNSKKTTALYRNERVDALTEEGKSAIDLRRARDIYAELQRLVWEDLPAIFLYYQPQIDAINKALTGYRPAFNERMIFVNTTLRK